MDNVKEIHIECRILKRALARLLTNFDTTTSGIEEAQHQCLLGVFYGAFPNLQKVKLRYPQIFGPKSHSWLKCILMKALKLKTLTLHGLQYVGDTRNWNELLQFFQCMHKTLEQIHISNMSGFFASPAANMTIRQISTNLASSRFKKQRSMLKGFD